jgi:hypothetical protein
MQRRTLLRLGIVSAAVLLVAGGTASLFQPGVQAGRLGPAGRTVFAGVGRAVLDGTLPAAPAAQAAAMAGLLERIDALVTALPAHAQAELSQLLGLLATAPGRFGLAGLSGAWDSAPVADVQAALQSMRISSLALKQQAYLALHDIVGGAYVSDASTWAAMGYPGPVAV